MYKKALERIGKRMEGGRDRIYVIFNRQHFCLPPRRVPLKEKSLRGGGGEFFFSPQHTSFAHKKSLFLFFFLLSSAPAVR